MNPTPSAQRRGPIAWMSNNLVAANLLMGVLLLGGFLSGLDIQQEVFPEFDMDWVMVTVPYPGATPAGAEEIVTSVEQAVGAVDGIDRITARASEGVATVFVKLLDDVDANKAMSDVRNAVDRITTMPRDAEEPLISLLAARREVITLVFHGHAVDDPVENEKVLRAYAEEARDRLKALESVTQVEVTGGRPVEMAVEVSQLKLRQHGITPEQLAARIRAEAIEVPGGGIKTAAGELLVRTEPRPEDAGDFAALPVLTNGLGSQLTVSDLARVSDGFAETDQSATFNGEPAIMLKVYRVADETPVEVANAVKQYVEAANKALPEGLTISTWIDWSEMYTQRLNLMVKNALLGFLLVLVILGLFLEIRLAFWVTIGIPVSFLGALLLMPTMDVTVNMISMFAFIVTLGMVVDDAIVVGENIYERQQRGHGWVAAAIGGTREVARPVTFSILTTVAAFMPMFFVPGISGKFFRVIPAIVICVLMISLVESFFILPAHLGHKPQKRPLRIRLALWVMAFLALAVAATLIYPWLMLWQAAVAGIFFGLVTPFALPAIGRVFGYLRGLAAPALQWNIRTIYRPTLILALKHRYTTLAVSLALFILALGLVAGGRLKFTFMPAVESDIVSVQAQLPFGAPVAETAEVANQLVSAAQQVMAENGGADELSRGIYARIGEGVPSDGPVQQGGGTGGHISSVQVFLVPSNERAISATEFVKRWREIVGEIASVDTMKFRDSMGPSAGMPIDIRLIHTDIEALERGAEDLARELAAFDGVKDIDAGFQRGKPQLEFDLTPLGEALGLTKAELGRQLRGAFYGAEALRQQRGRHEMKVIVRLPEDERRSEYNVESLVVRTPKGEMPFAAVATQRRSHAHTVIRRSNEQRAINVTADIDRKITTPEQVFGQLMGRNGALPRVLKRHPGLAFDIDGERRERMESMSALMWGSLFSLIVIFALLAIPFRSYLQPLVVMSAIPLGVGAAIYGHLLMGYDLSLISVMGIIALSGVVINDSLVLVDAANRAHRDLGLSPWRAIVWAGQRRFRPIVLTSLTTFFGLAPMIFETSMQARFLIPMAVSLGFGILIATFFILVSVPSVYLIIEDVKRLFGFAGPLHAPGEDESIDDSDLGMGEGVPGAPATLPADLQPGPASPSPA